MGCLSQRLRETTKPTIDPPTEGPDLPDIYDMSWLELNVPNSSLIESS